MAAVEIDFTNVKDRPGNVRVPKGDYKFKIAKVDDAAKSKAGNPMWVFDQEFLEGPSAGRVLRDYISLTPQALFKLRDLLEALGYKVGKKKIKVDPKKLVGKTVGAHVQDGEPYGERGTVKSEIGYYLPVAEVGPVPDPDEESVAGDKDDDNEPADVNLESSKVEEDESSDAADDLEAFDLDSLE